jgi:predicted RNA methylase
MDILKTGNKPKLDNSRDLESKLQEYFTNNTLAEYILTKSSIKSNTSKINVLEPTAGDGALVRPILKLGKDATVDMVEIDLNNRSKLKELVSLSPASLSLKEQGNFLKYLPSQRYDYIFMNPPFHLRKSENALLKKDVYDYDFVKRAFALLKVGGQLIAITSKKWTFTDDIKEWFESSNSIQSFDSVLKEGEKFGKVKIDITILNIIKENENEDNDILQHNFYNNNLEMLGKEILNNEAPIEMHKNKIDTDQYKQKSLIEDEQVGIVSKPKRKIR